MTTFPIRSLLAASCLAFGGAALAQAMPKATLNVVGNLGITTQSKELEAPMWTQAIPAASSGAITVTFKPWNEMGLKGGEVIKLLRQGLFDVGTTVLGFLAGEAAINDALDLAGVSTSIDMSQDAIKAFRPHLDAYYAKNQQVKVLAVTSYGDQVFFCRKEFNGLADLKGRKVRVSGSSQADFVEYFGGSGINMPFGDVQQALQNGVLDCAITGILGGYKAKWYEGATYLYRLPINFAASFAAANMKSWNKLSPAAQKVITDQYQKLEKDIYAQNVRENEIGIACNTGKGNCTEGPAASMVLVNVKPVDLELRRKALLERVLPRWAARCGEDCVKNWNDSVGKVVDLKAVASK